MGRRHPVNLEEERSDRYGDVAEHENREREQVGDDAPFLFAMDVMVLEYGREQREDEERHIEARKRHEERPDARLHFDIRSQKTVTEPADDQERAVREHGREGQEHARGDRHEHVVGGKAMEHPDGLDQMLSIRKEHLVKAFGPTHALFPRGGKGDRLLIEKLRGGETDLHAVNRTERGKLNVLGKGVELPSVHTLDDLRGNEIAGPRHGAGGPAQHASVVEKTGLAQKPGSVSARYP